jgi:hypothetical protein
MGVVVVVDVVVDGGFDVNLYLNMVTTVDEGSPSTVVTMFKYKSRSR